MPNHSIYVFGLGKTIGMLAIIGVIFYCYDHYDQQQDREHVEVLRLEANSRRQQAEENNRRDEETKRNTEKQEKARITQLEIERMRITEQKRREVEATEHQRIYQEEQTRLQREIEEERLTERMKAEEYRLKEERIKIAAIIAKLQQQRQDAQKSLVETQANKVQDEGRTRAFKNYTELARNEFAKSINEYERLRKLHGTSPVNDISRDTSEKREKRPAPTSQMYYDMTTEMQNEHEKAMKAKKEIANNENKLKLSQANIDAAVQKIELAKTTIIRCEQELAQLGVDPKSASLAKIPANTPDIKNEPVKDFFNMLNAQESKTDP